MSQPGIPPVPPPPSGSTPPPSGPEASPPTESAAPAGAASPPPDDPGNGAAGGGGERPRRRRGLIIGAVAAAVVVAVPSVAIAWRALDGGGTQPHEVLPSDAVAYFRFDLDPSASQKIEAFRFLRQFPAFGDATGITDEDEDLRQLLVEEFATATDCPIDFKSDIEPWVGERAGAAVLPPASDQAEPGLVLALQASDEKAAKDAVAQVVECGGDREVGTAFLDGYLLITDTAENAERYADSAQESPLAENADFREAMDLLGDPGVVSTWVSGTGMFDMFGPMSDLSDAYGAFAENPDLPSIDDTRQLIEDSYRSVAMTFRFDHDYAELASVVTGDLFEAGDGTGVEADLPADTTVLLGFADGGKSLQKYWETFKDSYPEASDDLANLEDTSGLALPDDLSTLLGESFVVALDAQGLDLESMMNLGDMSSLDLGLKVATDPDAAQEVWRQLTKLATDAGIPIGSFPMKATDDGYIVASNPDYAESLDDGGSLIDNDVYTTAVKDAGRAAGVFYLNVDALEDDLVSAVGGQLSEDELDSIRAIEALGFSAQSFDGHGEFTLRITAN